ncbi:hypothetical protein LEP1GSC176_1091 [Leptospira kirschneri str. MMD1493]|nr:hypothetical protein LEP1GSC176_1091 [Leptospira kirschneri str. MMD1493]
MSEKAGFFLNFLKRFLLITVYLMFCTQMSFCNKNLRYSYLYCSG